MARQTWGWVLWGMLLFWPVADGWALTGRIVDGTNQAPIVRAFVARGDQGVWTDAEGRFQLDASGDTLKVKAAGYQRREVPLEGKTEIEVALTPFQVKGLYLTVYGAAVPRIRDAAIAAVERNGMNALVIDIKGDRSFIPFPVDIPLAHEVGAQKTILVKDMRALVKALKEKNLYLIARIVVFKDNLLATARPEWAVRTKGGGIFLDRERLRWVDPFRREAWEYNIALAKIAADLGFDEVQFDYIRFPDNRGVKYAQPATEQTRTETITAFLETAYKALIPYNIMVGADIFGYVCWNTNDTDIGQKIAPIVNAVDVVCPMVYPSGYTWGIPNYRNPVKHTYETVYLSLKRAQERTGASPLKFRPWLQAFRDYAYGGGDYTEDRMRLQIKAAQKFGASGFMFWNARNIYPIGLFTDVE